MLEEVQYVCMDACMHAYKLETGIKSCKKNLWEIKKRGRNLC